MIIIHTNYWKLENDKLFFFPYFSLLDVSVVDGKNSACFFSVKVLRRKKYLTRRRFSDSIRYFSLYTNHRECHAKTLYKKDVTPTKK